jgi:hypothetical protein
MKSLLLASFVLLLFSSCGGDQFGDNEKYDYPITGYITCPMDAGGPSGSYRWEGECGTKITDNMKICPKCNTSVRYIKALEKEVNISVRRGEGPEELMDRIKSIDVPK